MTTIEVISSMLNLHNHLSDLVWTDANARNVLGPSLLEFGEHPKYFGREFVTVDNEFEFKVSFDATNISMTQTVAGLVASFQKKDANGLVSDIHSFYIGAQKSQGKYPASIDLDFDKLMIEELSLKYHGGTFTSSQKVVNASAILVKEVVLKS